MHAEQPFPDPRKHPQDLAASQALQPVPGMPNTSRAPSGIVSGSLRFPRQAQHAQQAARDEGQDELVEDLDEPASTGQDFKGCVCAVVCYIHELIFITSYNRRKWQYSQLSCFEA